MSSENKPFFNGMLDLIFDIDEIDGPLYMFDHAFSGCVSLMFSAKIGKIGTVLLNEKKHEDFKIINVIISENPVLCIKVRGVLCEYGKNATLHIEGFCDENGVEMEPQDFTVTVPPRRNSYPEKYAEHDRVAFRAAAESMVLLKNDGLLPLTGGEKLCLFGEGVAEYRSCAVGAGRINPRGCRSLLQAFEECSDFVINNELKGFYLTAGNRLPDVDMLARARQFGDTAVIVLTRGSGENIDNRPIKGEYYLSDDEEALIETVSLLFPKTVAVLNVGYPIDVSFLEKYSIAACVYSGYGGMFGADALVNLLDGRINPSGHLPDTWSRDYYDIPASRNFLNFGENEEVYQTDYPAWSRICYEEGLYIGYRYFTSFGKECAFPFGFGLSYTDFSTEIKELVLNGDEIRFKVTVSNTGKYSGRQTVQLYVSKPCTSFDQPAVELVAFYKTPELSSGEAVISELSVPIKHLASYFEESAEWKLFCGEYKFYSGSDAQNLSLIGCIVFSEEQVIKKVENLVCCELPFNEMNRLMGKKFPNGEATRVGEKKDFALSNRRLERPQLDTSIKAENIHFNQVEEDISLLSAFIRQMSDYELCRLSVCCNKSWNMEAKGEAGRIYRLENCGIPEYALADGNSGVNIKKPNIGMPASCMLAATFDKQLAFEVGATIAEEAAENGISLILGPAMNLHRNPLNGRGAEYFSEDPLLSGVMAGYQNKGFQSRGVSGCLKHVAANNCEAVRKRSDSLMSERTLREMYIRPFEYALEIEPSDTIMTGYNAVNGCFCDEDQELIEGIFYRELGFDGFVMSDWNSYDTSDMAKMVSAGVSLLTPGSDDDARVEPLIAALKDGRISRAELERNISRMLKIMIKRKSQMT